MIEERKGGVYEEYVDRQGDMVITRKGCMGAGWTESVMVCRSPSWYGWKGWNEVGRQAPWARDRGPVQCDSMDSDCGWCGVVW
jgi:hypothetical protein